MIRVDLDLESWLRRTSLSVEEYHCPKCDRVFRTEIPVLSHDYIGLESPIHECGPSYTGLVLSARSESERKIWSEIFKNF